jgi:hypothetical protein
MKHNRIEDNHVIVPGREAALEAFLNGTYKNMKHKLKNAKNSNSEDAVTWSCFDYIRTREKHSRISIINRLLAASSISDPKISLVNSALHDVHIGKTYSGNQTGETEVDASIETESSIVFFEAKLYSAMSLANPQKPHDQIAKKLRVGADFSRSCRKMFVFIIIDIAPQEKLFQRRPKVDAMTGLSGFHDKWKTAWWFDYYKNGRNGSNKPLKEILDGIVEESQLSLVSDNMGWLCWTDLFKIILQDSLNRE